MSVWKKSEPGQEEPEGYILGSGIQVDEDAAEGCTECKGEGFLVCQEAHLIVHKQRNILTGEERITGESRETCFGHLCRHCQPVRKLVQEKMRGGDLV